MMFNSIARRTASAATSPLLRSAAAAANGSAPALIASRSFTSAIRNTQSLSTLSMPAAKPSLLSLAAPRSSIGTASVASPIARGTLVRLASTASTATPSAPPTTTYMPPKHKPRSSFFATLGKVFATLLLLPVLLSVVFPSLLTFLVPAATILTVGSVLLLTAALVFGFILPLVLFTAISAVVPTTIVYNELNKMRNAKTFDSVAWEIVKPTRHWHFESDSHSFSITTDSKKNKNKKRVVTIDSTTQDDDLKLVSPYAEKIVDYFVDIGAIVETEIMRRDLLGHSDTAGYYGNVVAIKGKNIGFFGPLMARVEIPIDRAFIRARIAERAAVAKK
ncbi:UNVERIFIED_CONTAM: hypothetical protein HDU68_001381 [Siphonaria sp. JEL0065]|nr:hypothetical protein HDU68_001381 [Siphonaria sp. JEL0065]